MASVTAGDAGSYDVVVTGSCNSVTSATAAVTVDLLTTITTDPVSQTVCESGSVTFTVIATVSVAAALVTVAQVLETSTS